MQEGAGYHLHLLFKSMSVTRLGSPAQSMRLSHLARLVSLMAMLGHRSVTAYRLPLGLCTRYIQDRKVKLAINALVLEYAIENASNHCLLL